MDYEELIQCYKNNICTDIELHIKDNEEDDQSIIMKLHRIILICHSKYFNRLLSGYYAESNQYRVTIIVPDKFVTHDIIMSFYKYHVKAVDYPDWLYYMKEIQCLSFLELKYDLSKLKCCKIPEEGFCFLLQIIDAYFEYQGEIIFGMIYENFPNGFDLSALSSEFIYNLIKKLETTTHIIDVNGHDVTIFNPVIDMMYQCNTKICKSFAKENDCIISCVTVSSNGKIAFGLCNGKIMIYEIMDKTQIAKFHLNASHAISLDFSSDSEHIVSYDSSNNIIIWNLSTQTILRILGQNVNANKVKWSPNNLFIVSSNYSKIILWNAHDTSDIINQRTDSIHVCKMYESDDIFFHSNVQFTADSQYLVIDHNGLIKCIDIRDKSIIKTKLTSQDHLINHMCINFCCLNRPDLIIAANNKSICLIKIIDDNELKTKHLEIISFLDDEKASEILNICVSPDNKYIIIQYIGCLLKSYKIINDKLESGTHIGTSQGLRLYYTRIHNSELICKIMDGLTERQKMDINELKKIDMDN